MEWFSRVTSRAVIERALATAERPVRAAAPIARACAQVQPSETDKEHRAAASTLCAEPCSPPTRTIICRVRWTRYQALFRPYHALLSRSGSALYNSGTTKITKATKEDEHGNPSPAYLGVLGALGGPSLRDPMTTNEEWRKWLSNRGADAKFPRKSRVSSVITASPVPRQAPHFAQPRYDGTFPFILS
jgi:hypothetical protein